MWIVARLLIKTDRVSLIVLVDDVQGSRHQPAQVGANSTGPIVVIDSSVSVLALRGELRLWFVEERWTIKARARRGRRVWIVCVTIALRLTERDCIGG